jgi:two-component system, chemotaxis family, response regulator Rcp1
MVTERKTSMEILLVEDNAGDVRLTREAFREAGLLHTLQVVPDGIRALSFLRREGDYAGAMRPDLILLDLNIPRKDGREVLAEIKADPDLQTIPVVVLTTSQSEDDILASYHLHANCYIVKPVNLDQFMHAIEVIEDFWLKTVRLPSQHDTRGPVA